jgi:hypothetical protein
LKEYMTSPFWIPAGKYQADEGEIGMVAEFYKNGKVKKIHRRLFCP